MRAGYVIGAGDQYEHRLVAETALGHTLPAGAVIHHVDEDRTNSAPGNLVICQDQAYHMLLHARQRIIDAGGHPDMDSWCSYHQCLHPNVEFSTGPGRWSGLAHKCRAGLNEYRRENGLNLRRNRK